MTAYQLRNHLAEAHLVCLWGSPMHILVATHEVEHQHDQEHTHDGEAGHADFNQLLYLIILVLFIIVLLRVLGVQV